MTKSTPHIIKRHFVIAPGIQRIRLWRWDGGGGQIQASFYLFSPRATNGSQAAELWLWTLFLPRPLPPPSPRLQAFDLHMFWHQTRARFLGQRESLWDVYSVNKRNAGEKGGGLQCQASLVYLFADKLHQMREDPQISEEGEAQKILTRSLHLEKREKFNS